MLTKLIVGVAAFAATTSVMPASAAILADTTINGVKLDFGGANPGYAEKLKNDSAASGNPITLKGDQTGKLVDYFANSGVTLDAAGEGNGFAKVSAVNGFSTLTIDPQGSVGFSAIDFNLFVFDTNDKGEFFADISVAVQGMLNPVVFDDVLFTKNSNKFAVFDDDPLNNLVFNSITFSGLFFQGASKKDGPITAPIPGNFESMRQVSVNFASAPPPAVPEPATWAMMIAGFGLVGSAMRRRVTKVSFA